MAELSNPEFAEQAAIGMAGGKPLAFHGQCLLVLGPSAAGKTECITRGYFNAPENGIVLDGSYVRSVSAAWQSASALATSMGLAGFSDYFEGYFKAPTRIVKERVLAFALRKKANLIIHDTASTFSSTIATVNQILEAGYKLSFAAVYADRDVCEARGNRRSSKKYSSKNWERSLQAILDLHVHLLKVGALKEQDRPVIFNTSGQPHMVTPMQLQSLLEQHRTPQNGQCDAKWCEVGLLAGIYRAQDEADERFFEVIPRGSTGEQVHLTVNIVLKDRLLEVIRTLFFPAMCTMVLTIRGQERGLLLGLDSLGRATLTPREGGNWSPLFTGEPHSLVQIRGIDGKSLSCPVTEDADLLRSLDGLNFCRQDLRPWTEDELAAAKEGLRLAGPRRAPSRGEPRALLVVAPSGCGKSSLWAQIAGHFGMAPEECVLLDSGEYLRFHTQYSAILDNGQRNGGIWYRGWAAGKAQMAAAKTSLLAAASEARHDIVLSDTGSDVAKLVKRIESLKKQDYTVHLGGIFACPSEILARGQARETQDGKRYNRDVTKVAKAYEAFSPAIAAVNGRFALFKNPQGEVPTAEWYLEGVGGAVLRLDLAAALAVRTTPTTPSSSPQRPARADFGELSALGAQPPLELELPASDLQYLGEGAANVVLGYRGPLPELQGAALRFRKDGAGQLENDLAYAKRVMEPIVGSEYLEVGRLVSVSSDTARAVDEAIFDTRPEKRRHKRITTSEGGRVMALRLANLNTAPVAGAHVLTVELKTKCGLLERQGLPSRFQLLQHFKLRDGSVARLSPYDPVKLLSKRPASIREAFLSVLREPQNNVAISLDGDKLFSEATGSQGAGKDDGAQQPWEAHLTQVGISSKEALADLVAEVLGHPECTLPDRMKRAQAWASGETAPLVCRLYTVLREKLGKSVDEVLADVDNFLPTARQLERWPCDESGITQAVNQLDELLARVHSRPWTEELQREVIAWCCRFLVGRCVHDVSVMVNFALVEPSELTQARMAELKAARYQLQSLGPLWYRLTVVDCDRKGAAKIPEYATQLDRYAQAYYNRFATPQGSSEIWDAGPAVPAASSDASPMATTDTPGEALGGHEGGIIFRGSAVWKRDQGGERGLNELAFLRWAAEDSNASRHVPTLVGYCTIAGERYIGMSNLLHGLREPAVADIKMGTRTWGTDATPEKVKSQSAKAMKRTTGVLGLYVVAAKYPVDNTEAPADTTAGGSSGSGSPARRVERVGGSDGRQVRDESEVADFLRGFLPTAPLRNSALARIRDIAKWWTSQEKFAIYAGSLLLAYDTVERAECKVVAIDFTHAERISDKSQDLSGCDKGFESLIRILSSL